MNFLSQSAKPNNLRLQQPLSVCSNLLRSLERGCYWKSFPFSAFRFPFCAPIGSNFHHMSFNCSYYSEIFTTFAKLLAYEK